MSEELNNFTEEDQIGDQWENMTPEVLRFELMGLNNRFSEFANLLRELITSNDYSKAMEKRDALLQSDLSKAGWLSRFHTLNSDSFSKFMNGPGRPAWYSDLTPEKKKQYETVLEYYKDTFYLLNACDALTKLLLELPIKSGFKLLCLVRNFDKAGFDSKMYSEIAWDVKSVSALMAMSSSDFDRKAEKSRTYYEANRARLSKPELIRGYRQERIRDYQACVKDAMDTSNFVEHSGGRYTVKSSLLARLAVIDNYTYELSLMKDLNEQMEKKSDESAQILQKEVGHCLKNCKMELTKGLAAAFASAVEAVKEFADECTGTIDDFHNESFKTPYCFMIQPAYFDRIVQNFSFRPQIKDPWEKGTNFREIYQMAARALSEQCDYLANQNGLIS